MLLEGENFFFFEQFSNFLDFQIPSSAVEMPGSADVSGLNVQFGALDFASEAAVEVTGQSETSSQESAPPVTQTQSNLYSKPITVG